MTAVQDWTQTSRLEQVLAATGGVHGWAAAVTRQELRRRAMAARVAQQRAWEGLRDEH